MAQIIEQSSSSFFDLERQRLLLEQNVVKFREYLQNWQTWEAEYEGFKEEILALRDDHTDDDLNRIGSLFGGTLLNEKEIDLLLEDKNGQKRSRDQVVGLLNRRIDYVQQNIKTIEVLLKRAEDQAAASLLANEPEIRDSEGLPMTEIREELDEEGNVISSSITIPNDTPPKILETLRKASVELPQPHISWTKHPKEEPELETTNAEPSNINKNTGEAQDQDSGSGPIEKSLIPDQPVDRQVIDKPSIHRKKSVTFAEGTKKEDATSSKRQVFPLRPKSGIHPLTRVKDNAVQGTRSNHTEDAVASKIPAASAATSGRSDKKIHGAEPFSAVVPADESPEDAALRRQMIQYNMEEVGSVVAEINLDEEDSDSGTDQEFDQFGSSTDEDEDEDEFGRTKRPVVGDEYRMEMLALEKKLNAMPIQNIGPEASVPQLVKSGLGAKKVDIEKSNTAKQDRKTSPTKEVRFADQLEINGLPSFTPSQGLDETTGMAGKPQLDSPIAEQATSSSGSLKTLPSTKKISRFKSGRNGSTLVNEEPLKPPANPLPATTSKSPIASTVIERSAPQPTLSPPPASLPSSTKHSAPSGAHAATIIEHPYSKSTNAPPEPDDLDPSLLHQQVATEYHRMRNQMIHRQGGFLASAEEEANQGRMKLTKDDGERKVSRFKAARLRMG